MRRPKLHPSLVCMCMWSSCTVISVPCRRILQNMIQYSILINILKIPMSWRFRVPCDINIAFPLRNGLWTFGLDGLSDDRESVSEILEPPRIGDHLIFFNNLSFMSFVDCLLGLIKWPIIKLRKDPVREFSILVFLSDTTQKTVPSSGIYVNRLLWWRWFANDSMEYSTA